MTALPLLCGHNLPVTWWAIDGVTAWRHHISGSACPQPPRPWKKTGYSQRLRVKA